MRKPKNRKLIFLILIIFLIMIIKVIPILVLSNVKTTTFIKEIKAKKSNIEYNFQDLIQYMKNEITKEKVIFNAPNIRYKIDDKKVQVNVTLTNKQENCNYIIKYGINNNLIEESMGENKTIEFSLENEGKNNCYIAIQKDNNIIDEGEWNEDFYYIDSYKEQFADELSNKGIAVHYQNGNWERYDRTGEPLKALGVKYIRTDFSQSAIQKNDNIYDFSKYDEWLNDLTSTSEIQPIILLNGVNAGDDKLINNDEEVQKFVNFVDAVQEHYPEYKNIEVLNEVNYTSSAKGGYHTQEEMQWYSNVLNNLGKKDRLNKIMTGGTAPNPTDTYNIITPATFVSLINNTSGLDNINGIAHHPYSRKSNDFFNEIKKITKISNLIGGFNNINATEFGYSSLYTNDDKEQGELLLKMTVNLEESSNLISLYNLWTVTSDLNSVERFGLLNSNYTPKDSYYIMKKYYEKTNGGEYIGYFQLTEGTFAHVYDKDGKILLIVWTNDENNTDEVVWSDNKKEEFIDYTGFNAYDIYGNEIEAIDGKLKVTSTPIYIENISDNYYFKAINNLVINKYDKFLSTYNDILNDEIKNQINTNKQFIEGLLDKTQIDENTAVSAMNSNFEIGNKLLELFRKEKIELDYVKLSSMLDSLNDIRKFI